MAKRPETMGIENAMHAMCRKKRLYGCEEVTIGFANNGHGNEIVDFMLMDSKGSIRCYEIKVTLQDMKSKARLSWYGHYNYLLVYEALYEKIAEWSQYVPDFVGISVCRPYGDELVIVNKRRPVRQDLTSYQELMVKNGFIRSLVWKMWKYKDASDMEYIQKLKGSIRCWKKTSQSAQEEAGRIQTEYRLLRKAIREYRRDTGIDLLKKYEMEGWL